MKTEFDGFKTFEGSDDYEKCIIEMYNNELLLREKIMNLEYQIDDLRRKLDDR
jgi:hypothetical protein